MKALILEHVSNVEHFRIQTLMHVLPGKGHGQILEKVVKTFVKNVRARGDVSAKVSHGRPCMASSGLCRVGHSPARSG